MATLSSDRGFATSTLSSSSSRAELGKLLLALKQGKPYPQNASTAVLEVTKKVHALRFNCENDKNAFITELIFWVKDCRLPIPDTDIALQSLMQLHLVCMSQKSDTFLLLAEIRLQFNLTPCSFYKRICYFIHSNVVSAPKESNSWWLIIALMAHKVKWIYIESLTYHKTIDIVDRRFTIAVIRDLLFESIECYGRYFFNHVIAYRKMYVLIQLILSGDEFDNLCIQRAFDFIDKTTEIDMQGTYIRYYFHIFDKQEVECLYHCYKILPLLNSKIGDIHPYEWQASFIYFISTAYREYAQRQNFPLEKFFQYIPVYMLQHYSRFDMPLLSHVGMGNNIRTYGILSTFLSKKAAHIIHNVANHEVIPQNLIVYAHLKSLDIHAQLIENLSYYFRFDIRHIGQTEQSSWQFMTSIALFLNNNITTYWTLAEQERHIILGYLQHCLQDVANYSIKGRTLATVQRAANEWFEENSVTLNNDKTKSLPIIWKGAPYQEWNQLGDDNQWYAIFQLTSQLSLNDESAYMSHCVRSYVSNCMTGACSIWSLRVRQNSIWLRLATIEVNNQKQIVQIKARFNMIPAHEHLLMVKDWASREGLQGQ